MLDFIYSRTQVQENVFIATEETKKQGQMHKQILECVFHTDGKTEYAVSKKAKSATLVIRWCLCSFGDQKLKPPVNLEKMVKRWQNR